MSESRKDRIERLERYVINTRAVLLKLDKATLEHLVRSAEETSEIDGYSAGGFGEKVSGSSNSDEGGSTLAAVIARRCPRCDGEGSIPGDSGHCKDCAGTGDRFIADPLSEALDEIFTRLTEMSGHAVTIGRKLPIVIDAASRMRGRVSTLGQCQACHRDVACTTADPIRSGYCSACDVAWRRWRSDVDTNDPGRARQIFEDQREKFDGHLATACQVCIQREELRRIAS